MGRAPRFFWLVDATFGGVTYRWSTEDQTVETAAGDELIYRAGLSPLALAQGDVEVDVTVADATVAWPYVGPLLEGAAVVVRRWQQGTVLEAAEVCSRGTATDAEWGASSEPAQWTTRPVEALPPMPDPTAVVSPITTEVDEGVADIPGGQMGMYYPVVFGFPGRYTRQYTGETSGLIITSEQVVPCPMRVFYHSATDMSESEIVISADASGCLPDTVNVMSGDNGLSADLVVKATTDALGRRIGVCTLTDFTIFTMPDEGPTYFAAYGPDDGGQGGGGRAAPRDAYDVIVYVLQHWGGDTVDWSRIPEIRDHLRGYLVDTWIDAECEGGVWRWLVDALGVADAESTVAAGLPVAIRTSAGGRYLTPLRYAVDPARTVRTLDVSRGEVSRVSGIRTKGEIANVVEVKYGYELSSFSGHTSTPAILAATRDVGTSSLTAVAPNALAVASTARYGPRMVRIDAPWTWDHGTTLRLADDRIARDALPWRYVQYRVPEAWRLREGDQVRLVDAELAVDELAIVHEPPYIGADDGVTVTLRMPGRA